MEEVSLEDDLHLYLGNAEPPSPGKNAGGHHTAELSCYPGLLDTSPLSHLAVSVTNVYKLPTARDVAGSFWSYTVCASGYNLIVQLHAFAAAPEGAELELEDPSFGPLPPGIEMEEAAAIDTSKFQAQSSSPFQGLHGTPNGTSPSDMDLDEEEARIFGEPGSEARKAVVKHLR